jgi:hypothetical protein
MLSQIGGMSKDILDLRSLYRISDRFEGSNPRMFDLDDHVPLAADRSVQGFVECIDGSRGTIHLFEKVKPLIAGFAEKLPPENLMEFFIVIQTLRVNAETIIREEILPFQGATETLPLFIGDTGKRDPGILGFECSPDRD